MCADRPVWPWSELGADGPLESPAEVRRAYSRRLKGGDWQSDVDGFETLRRAYEAALELTGGGRQRHSVVTDLPPPPPLERHRPRIRVPDPSEPAENPVGDAETAPPPPVTPPDTAPDAPQDLLPDLTAEADDRPAPKPAPQNIADGNSDASPQAQGKAQTPDPWLILAKIQQYLDDKNFSAENWSALLHAPEMDDAWIRLSAESKILDYIARPKPWTHSADWIRLIDSRFGWRADGVGFLRRHPHGEAALVNIIDQLGGPRREGPGAGKFRLIGGALWSVVKWLFRLGLLILAVRLLNRYAIISADQFVDFINAIFFPVLLSGLRLMIAIWVLRRIARLVARFSNWGWRNLERFRASWAKPFFGMRRTRVLYVLVMSIPAIALAPTYFGSSARPGMPSETIESLSAALSKSLYQATGEQLIRYGSVARLPLPNFILPRNSDQDGVDTSDPYDSAMIARLMDDVEADAPISQRVARGPRARLTCGTAQAGQTPSCHLALRADLNAVRQVRWPNGKYSSYLHMPVLHFSSNRVREISASWANPVYSGIDTKRLDRAMATSNLRSFSLSVQMFMASLEHAGGKVSLQQLDRPAQAAPIPAEALGQPMTLSFDWPDDLRDTVKCSGLNSAVPDGIVVKCGIADARSAEYGTWACPADSPPESCNISPVHDKDAVPQVQAGLVETPTLSTVFDDAEMLVLESLMQRISAAGAPPALADNAASRRIRDAVLRDYALILDRPEAAAWRDDVAAIRAALTRQPQLYWTYRASRARRDAVWAHVQKQLRDLGFPVAQGEMDSPEAG